MKGVRVSVKMGFKNPFFIEKEYKSSISKRLYELGIRRFTFSDLVCRRKKVIEEGFYAVDEARFDFTTIYFEGVYDAINKIARDGIDFKFGRVLDVFVDVKRIEFFNECYLLSPVLVLDEEGRSVDFVENPALYNKLMRDKIVKRYIDVFGKLPQKDSFIIVFKNTPEKVYEDGKIFIKSKCELYGSKELIYLSNCIGIGDKNEEGFGMISEDLYFYR